MPTSIPRHPVSVNSGIFRIQGVRNGEGKEPLGILVRQGIIIPVPSVLPLRTGGSEGRGVASHSRLSVSGPEKIWKSAESMSSVFHPGYVWVDTRNHR